MVTQMCRRKIDESYFDVNLFKQLKVVGVVDLVGSERHLKVGCSEFDFFVGDISKFNGQVEFVFSLGPLEDRVSRLRAVSERE